MTARATFDKRARHLRRRLQRFPQVEPFANRLGLWLWRRDLRRRAKHGSLDFHDAQPIAIDPRRVISQVPAHAIPGFEQSATRHLIGWTLGGDWDISHRSLEEHPVVQGIHQHFEGLVPWEQTDMRKSARAALDRGDALWKFRSEDDITRIEARIESLYTSIAESGYRTQKELGTDRLWDEILVAIDRRGTVHLIEGAHRLAIAQSLALRTVPALVGVRHCDWAEFRAELEQYADDSPYGLYQRPDHPDLAHVPFEHGQERLDLIRPHLIAGEGTALDIGANSGFFSFRLNEIGFATTAVERSQKECYILERLVDSNIADIRILRGSIFDVALETRYSVVLALNIFHHFFKSEAATDQLEMLLGRLQAEQVFVETHDPAEPQMRAAFFNPDGVTFASWVAERMNLDSVERIADLGGRQLYVLS